MTLNLYTVFDEKAAAYLQPFFAPTDGVAIRNFTAAIADTEHSFARHAEDYTLWLVGTFDQADGSLETGGLVHIAYAHHIKAAMLQTEEIARRNNGSGFEETLSESAQRVTADLRKENDAR